MNVKVVFAALIALVVSLGVLTAKEAGIGPFDPSLPVSLSQPVDLKQINAVHHYPIKPGEWMKTNRVTFAVARPRSSDYKLQIKLVPGNASATTITGLTPSDSAVPSVTIPDINNGAYRWWARFYNGKAVSNWAAYSATTAFGVDTAPVGAPQITSLSYPSHTVVYPKPKGAFAWTAPATTSGIRGYWYQLLPKGIALPHAFHVVTKKASAQIRNLATGTYDFAVAAQSIAGTWGRPATYPVRVDTTPPSVTAWGFSIFSFNPKYNSVQLRLSVNRPARVRIGIYRSSDGHRVRLVTRQIKDAHAVLRYNWHGRDGKALTAAGLYTFAVRTTDAFGNTTVTTIPQQIGVTYKRIVVSLAKQELWAYDGNALERSSLVTTGNVHELPTPPGHFMILDMRHPYTFVSESPPGSAYWYPPSPVQYAMLFKVGGYYIHDAPWRTAFGPGTNTELGAPGSPDTGTHGCINVPNDIVSWLYNWSEIGVPVIVNRT